jgi:AP-2 complex subunit beta-1
MADRSPTKSTLSYRISFRSGSIAARIAVMLKLPQDCNDRNPLIRALAIRTMSYIPIPIVTDALTDNLRHCLKDQDPYVRKTAAICVAKLYSADPRRAEKAGFVEMLRDLMLDSNATVVANAVAALSEVGDRQDGVIFKLNLATANKLLTALGESSE